MKQKPRSSGMERMEKEPSRIASYFLAQKPMLLVITLTGIGYNTGVAAGPWFEGQIALHFVRFLKGSGTAQRVVRTAVFYLLTILLVQSMRLLKRLYVRKFANNIRLAMRRTIYRSIVKMDRTTSSLGKLGEVMTKVITDVDACAEGMRKFLTELFDTGIAMVVYLLMLFHYDIRLTLLVMLFPPLAYVIAERIKGVVTQATAASRESAEQLSGATYDRVRNAVTYRIYGCEKDVDQRYEEKLTQYERAAIRANVWENTMQPVYYILAMIGCVFIIYLGGKNVLGTGRTSWTIASFTTYLACFLQLSRKTSHAAKLFNALQKAGVSWERIRPFMKYTPPAEDGGIASPAELVCKDVSFAYPKGQELEKTEGEGADAPQTEAAEVCVRQPGAKNRDVISDLNITVKPGELIGVTGAIASGKSTLGRLFLCESPYRGSIRYGGRELSELASSSKEKAVIGYMGHNPELFSDTIEANIRLGKEGDIAPYLRAVCMDEEVAAFPEGVFTKIGDGGVRLSGGQKARIALARTLFHSRPVLILDDPFSAVDLPTAERILSNIRGQNGDCTILLLSHRLESFDRTDQVIFLESGRAIVSTHEALLADCPAYRTLCLLQSEGKGGESA
jgi:ATP-binding cassette subfamily B multidrug efflux pump